LLFFFSSHWGYGQEIVARVNGEPITRQQLIQALLERAGRSILEELINETIIQQALEKAHIRITPEMVEKRLQQFREKNFDTEEKFRAWLEEKHLTLAALRREIELELGIEELVKPGIKVTEEDIQLAYRRQAKRMRVRHILVRTEAEARELRQRLLQGEDFATLARKYSLDTGTAGRGGDLNYFNYYAYASSMPKFAETVFRLKVGEISKPIPSPFGYHIARVDDIKEPPPMTREQHDQFARELYARRLDEAKRAWFQQAKAQAQIEWLLGE